jgi:hypothetical protein
MESTRIPQDAEHEVLSAASSIPKSVLVGAAAGGILGKSLGWAVAGGVAGWLYDNAKSPQAVGCVGCGYGADRIALTRPTIAPTRTSVDVTRMTEVAADATEAEHAPTEEKSILPLLLVAGGAWWLFG